MNQLQAVALNEGLRCKKRLWRLHGREQLESFRLAPWASRRREDLLQLLDRLNPTINDLTQVIEQEVEKCPEAGRLRTHPGVGALSGLSLRIDHRKARAISVREADRGVFRVSALGGLKRKSATTGPYYEAREFDVALLAGGSGPSYSAQHSGMAQ